MADWLTLATPNPHAAPADIVANHFAGHDGTALLQDVVDYARTFAAAQAPADEIVGAIMVRFALDSTVATAVVEHAADAIDAARLSARAAARLAIHNLCHNPEAKPAQVAILKEFAVQHLDWSRKTIDEDMAGALKEADKVARRQSRK